MTTIQFRDTAAMRRRREAQAFRHQIQELVTEEQKRDWAAQKYVDAVRVFGAVYGEQGLIEQLANTLEQVRRLALRGPRAEV